MFFLSVCVLCNTSCSEIQGYLQVVKDPNPTVPQNIYNLTFYCTLLANKNGRDYVFGQYLREIFTKFKKEGQFCNLLVLSFSKLPLLLIFGQVEAEKIEVKDTRGYFHFFTQICTVSSSFNSCNDSSGL